MSTLNLAAASLIIDGALEKARALELAPLCVVVLDAGGHMIACKREDGASLLRPDIATGKAFGCLAMGLGGRELARKSQTATQFLSAVATLAQGKLVPVPGGVLIRNSSGAILGAVGVSGDASPKDEACAVAGIQIANLKPDTGDEA